jgi:hypothetical protein
MPKSDHPYPREVKSRLIELVRAGRATKIAVKFFGTTSRYGWVSPTLLSLSRSVEGVPIQISRPPSPIAPVRAPPMEPPKLALGSEIPLLRIPLATVCLQ